MQPLAPTHASMTQPARLAARVHGMAAPKRVARPCLPLFAGAPSMAFKRSSMPLRPCHRCSLPAGGAGAAPEAAFAAAAWAWCVSGTARDTAACWAAFHAAHGTRPSSPPPWCGIFSIGPDILASVDGRRQRSSMPQLTCPQAGSSHHGHRWSAPAWRCMAHEPIGRCRCNLCLPQQQGIKSPQWTCIAPD